MLCEKPLANTVEEAEQMAAAAREAVAGGVYAMCGFTYRRTPALAYAKQLIDEGRLGTIRHVRGQYLQDWLHDADAPMTWRLDKATSGLGCPRRHRCAPDRHHPVADRPVDQRRVRSAGDVRDVPTAGRRAVRSGRSRRHLRRAPRGEVTVDDAALFTARFDGGAIGSFEASRFALGRKNAFRVEINGTDGSVAFDFEDNNVVEFFDGRNPVAEQGFRRILVTEPEHPYVSAWWPPGHGLGYEHGFTHQVVDLVTALAEARQPTPSFDDGLQVQQVLAAVETSAGQLLRLDRGLIRPPLGGGCLR